MLIVSNETLKSRGIGVTSFSAHLCIGSFLAGLAAMATLKVLYRNKKFGSVQDAEIRAWETELRLITFLVGAFINKRARQLQSLVFFLEDRLEATKFCSVCSTKRIPRKGI